MVTTGIPVLPRPSPWRLIGVMAVIAAFALWFVDHSVLQYLQYDPKIYGELWPRRYGFLLHVTGGFVALSAGLVQIWLGFTGRTSTLHRTLGRVYVSGVLVGSTGAFYLALTLDPKDVVYAAGLFLLGVAWLVTTATAILSIRRRAYEQHREWMIRSYTVTFAFVTFRLLSQWLRDLHFASPDDVDTIMAWACWAVPLLLLEPLLQLRRMRVRR